MDSENKKDRDQHSQSPASRDVLSLMDDFIEQIQGIRKLLLGVSLSAIVLAPLAIALSLYLITHPSFFAVLERENEFGLALAVLLGAVIVISAIWLTTGIRQHRSMSGWKKRYDDYVREKEEIDKQISLQFGLDKEQR